MSGELGAAGISAAGSIISNVMSGRTSKKVAKMNINAQKEMQQIGNEFNANEAAKARDWQAEQWQKQFDTTNAYNDPKAQRQRMEAAGYNAALMADSGNIGSGTSAGGSTPSASPVSSISPSSPGVQAYRYDFSGISDALNSYFLNRKTATETSFNEDRNGFGSDYWKSVIAGNLGGNMHWLTDAYQDALKQRGGDFAHIKTQGAYAGLDNLVLTNELNKSQTTLNLLNADAQRTMNKYMDSQQAADLITKSQVLNNLVLSGAKTRAEISTELEKAILYASESAGKKISNDVAKKTAQDLIEATNMSNRYDSAYKRAALRYAGSSAMLDYDLKRYARDIKGVDKRKSDNAWNRTIGSFLEPFKGILGVQMK